MQKLSLKSCSRAAAGSAAIEFAVLAPVLLMVLFGVTFLGKMYFDQSTLQTAVESAGRMITLNSAVTQAQLQTAIQNQIGIIGNPTVTVTYAPTTLDGVSVEHLSASMTKTYAVPLLKKYTFTYKSDTYVAPNTYTGS